MEGSYQMGSFFFCEVKSMVKVNGEEKSVAGMTLEEYLAETSYDSRRIAVERNGEIVPKGTYGQVILQDGDSVEVVSFVGGG